MKQLICKMLIKKLLNLFLLCINLTGCLVLAREWSCNTVEKEKSTLSEDCSISGGNHVFWDIDYVGNRSDMNYLVTVKAVRAHRHFYINDANSILILRLLRLVDGDVSGEVDPVARRRSRPHT